MASNRRRIPKYRHYKPKNLAVVRIDGRDHYLGKYDSAESWERYHRTVADWLRTRQAGTSTPVATTPPPDGGGISVNGLLLAYWDFADAYYRKHDQPTGEADNIRAALRPLRKLYGSTPAMGFGPDGLDLVRQSMIDAGLSRNVINARVSRIKRMFRWASKKRLVPAETYYGLMSVEGLLRGRSKARDRPPVTTVPDAHVAAVLPHVLPHVRAMIQVQELTGMRPQDIRNMRTADIDMNEDVWVYKPWTHKTEHFGITRLVAIGPKAQSILRPFLKHDRPEEYIFSPHDAVAARRKDQRHRRRTPLTPSQRARKPKTRPQRVPGNQYTRGSYEVAVKRACEKAAVPPWTPNQLRHNCATRVRQKYGAEGAAAVLGNSLGMVVEIYAESNFALAKQIMREIG